MITSILTILFVLFILFVFRRLDKNNLRLNKVKVFIDRQLERLADYDRQKKEEIQGLEGALSDLINRAETVNRSIDTKMESFAQKEETIRNAEGLITETEKRVEELLSRMAKSDKDLAWIKDQSGIVVATGDQVKVLRREMETLTKDLREREQKLSGESQERYKSVHESFIAKIDGLKNQVLLTESKLSEKLNHESENLNGVIRRIKDTFSFSEKSMQAELRKLREQVPAFLQKISEDFRNQKDTLFQDSLAKIRQFNEVVKGIEITHLSNKNQLIEGFKGNLRDLESRIEEAKARFGEEMGTIQRGTLERIGSFQSVIDRQEEDYQKTRDKHLAEVQTYLREINQAVTHAKGDFEAIRKDSKTRFDQNFGQIQKKFEEKIDSYTVQSKDLFGRLNEEKKKITSGINEKIAELNQKSADLLKLVNGAEKSVQSAITVALKGTQETLGRIEKEARVRHAQTADESFQKLNTETDRRLGLLHSAMEKSLGQINLTAETATKKFLEEQQSALAETRSQFGRLQSELTGVSQKFSDQETVLLQGLRGRIENLDREYVEKLRILEKQYADFEAKVSRNITKDISEFQSKELFSRLNEEKKRIAELSQKSTDALKLVNGAEKNVQSAIAAALKETQESLDRIEKESRARHAANADEALQKMNREADRRLDLLHAAMEKNLGQINQAAETATKKFLEEQQSALKEAGARIENLDKEYDGKLDLLGKKYADFEARVGRNIAKDISEFQSKELFSRLNEEKKRIAELGQKSNDALKLASGAEKNIRTAIDSALRETQDALGRIEKEARSRHAVNTDEVFQKMNREADRRLDLLHAAMEKNIGQINQTSDAARKKLIEEQQSVIEEKKRIAEISQKSAETLKLVNNAEKNVQSAIAGFMKETQDSLGRIEKEARAQQTVNADEILQKLNAEADRRLDLLRAAMEKNIGQIGLAADAARKKLLEDQQSVIEEKKRIAEISQKSAETLKLVTSAEKNVQSEIAGFMKETQESLGRIEKEARAQQTANADEVFQKLNREADRRLDLLHAAMEKNIGQIGLAADAARKKLLEDQQSVIEEKKRIAELGQKSTETLKLVANAEKNVQSAIAGFMKETQDSLGRIEKEARAQQTVNADEVFQKMNREADRRLELLHAAMEKNIGQISLAAETARKKLLEDQQSVIEEKKRISDLGQKSAETLKLVNSAEKNIQSAIAGALKETQESLGRIEKEARARHAVNADEVFQKMSREADRRLELLQTAMVKNLGQINQTAEAARKKLLEDQQSVIEEKKRIAEISQKSAETLKLVTGAEKNIQSAIAGFMKETQDALGRIEKESRARHTVNADDVFQKMSREADRRLELLHAAMEKNLGQINQAAETATKKFLEEQQSALEETRVQFGRLQSEMAGLNLKFSNQETSLMQGLRGRVENLDKEYGGKLKILEKQYAEFEGKVSKNITKDITEFQSKLTAAAVRYDRTAEDLLRETRGKLAGLEASLKQVETKVGGTEKEYAARLDEKLKSMDGTVDQRMVSFQELVNEREKKVVEKLKTDVERANENIRRLEGLLRENEERIRKSSKEMLSSFSEFLERHKSTADRSMEEFRKLQEQRLDETSGHFTARLKATDLQLDRIIDDQKKKIQDRSFKLREEFAKIKESARTDVQAFITEFSDKLGDLTRTYGALEQKSKNIEKNFLETVQSQVAGFSREIIERINGFRGELKLTEKNNSQKMNEFIQRLDQDYQSAKSRIVEETNKGIQDQHARVEEISGRIAKLQKDMDYFLKSTKLYENADKLRAEIRKDLDAFNADIERIRGERQYLDKVDRRLESLRKNEESISKTLEALQADRRRVEQIDAQVKSVKTEIEEMAVRLGQFGKDKEQIAELQQKFRTLDKLVDKVGNSLDQFAGRETDLKRFSSFIESLDKNLNALERRSESHDKLQKELDERSGDLGSHIQKLEQGVMELGSKEEELKQVVKGIGSIETAMEFLDTKTKQIESLRKWVLTAEGNLNGLVQAGDERIKDLKHLLDEATRLAASAGATPRSTRQVEREPEAQAPVRERGETGDARSRIVGLRQQGWSPQQIARRLGLPLQEVLDILKRNSL